MSDNSRKPDPASQRPDPKTHRAVLWLILGALTAGCGFVSCDVALGDQQSRIKPVATVAQIMDAIVIPSSQAIFDAVVYDNGQLVQAPGSDDDWFRLQMHALAVAEAGNLLQTPTRAKDTADWAMMSAALTDAAVHVAEAAESKDIERLLASGSEMYNTCTSCHRKYIPEMEN